LFVLYGYKGSKSFFSGLSPMPEMLLEIMYNSPLKCLRHECIVSQKYTNSSSNLKSRQDIKKNKECHIKTSIFSYSGLIYPIIIIIQML